METNEKKLEFRGRKGKLTRKMIKSIASKVRKGATFKAAALSSGISNQTLHKWIARGKTETSGIYRELVDTIEANSAQVEIEITESIVDIIREKGDGRVGLEFLRRRSPGEWNIPERSEVAQTGALSFVVDLGGELNSDSPKP
tara:strand:+ start:133 stop:561 length:429 start_codon:yes stop_codon:yes gene_type:complete